MRLAYLEEDPGPELLHSLDLYALSELRRPKGGGCEIRLYDRMKALELLLQHAGSPGAGASGFLEALRDAAAGKEPGAV